MKKYEGKISLTKMISPNSLSISSSQFPTNRSNVIEDELVIYINELSTLIKQYYKLNNQNFVQIKNTLNKPNQSSQKENLTRFANQSNKNFINSFQKIESSLNSFYSNAKDIFHKMKICHNQHIENSRKNESINKIMVTNNNINISNSIIHNESYKKNANNIEKNIKMRFEKTRNEREELQNDKLMSSSNYLNPFNSYLNNSNQLNQKYLKTYGNYESIPNSIMKTESINNSNEEQFFSDNDIKESEQYKKTLNQFSKDVYHFLGLVQQLQNTILNFKNIQDNFKLNFEREKNVLTQTCLKYLSNTNPKISLINTPSMHKSKTRNIISSSIKNSETVKIESEYDKLRNDFENLNKELFITQRENNELKNEIDKLRKSLTTDDIIKININNNEKENELSSSINSFKNDDEFKKNYKIIKNENKNMKGIITNLSREIAEMKKINYEFSPTLENRFSKDFIENKIDYSYSATPKKKNISNIGELKNEKNDYFELKINNLTKKNNEMANQIKEMNMQRNNCLNILKQNEMKIKEQQQLIEKYIIENEKLKSNKNILNIDKNNKEINNNEWEEKIEKLENDILDKNKDIEELEKKNYEIEQENLSLVSKNNDLSKENKEFKNSIKKYENENKKLNSEVLNLNNQISTYEKENKKIISENKDLKKNFVNSKKNIDLYNNEKEKLNSRISELTEIHKKEKGKLNIKISELSGIIETNKKEKGKLNIKISELTDTIDTNNKEKEELISKISELTNIIDTNNKEKEKLNSKITELTNNDNKEKEKLNFKITELRNNNNKEIENLKVRISELTDNNNKEIESLLKNKEEIEGINQELKMEVTQLNNNIKKLKKENKEQSDYHNKFKKDYEKEFDNLSNEVNKLNLTIKKLKNENFKFLKENIEMKKQYEKEKKNYKLKIDNIINIEFININEISSDDKNAINKLKKKIENYSFENKILIEEKEKNYKEIVDLKNYIEELKNQIKNPSSLNYLKTNSKISISSFNKKDENIDDNDKLLSQYENERDLENEKEIEEKTLSKQDNNISDINEQQCYFPIEKKKSISKHSSKFKSKSITELDFNNNINIQDDENNFNNNKNNNNNNNVISPETHELIKIFQYNRKIRWYLFKIKNSNKEETFEDFIWKEQRSRKTFSDFTSIPKNDSIELQRQIENLEEKKKELENKLLKKESDYNRLSVNYAKLFNRKKNEERNPDKLKNDIEQLKKENKHLQNLLNKYKQEENIFGISFIQEDLEGEQFIDELNFEEIIESMSKYGIYTYGVGRKDDYNIKERLKKTVQNLISQIHFTKNVKVCLGSIFKLLRVNDDDIYDLIGKYRYFEK